MCNYSNITVTVNKHTYFQQDFIYNCRVILCSKTRIILTLKIVASVLICISFYQIVVSFYIISGVVSLK